MGLLDRFKRKKELDNFDTMPPRQMPTSMMEEPQAAQANAFQGGMKAQMDLMMSQMENLRIQYEAISARLSAIERLVTEIRSFCR